jgi:hypothetical protein
MSRSKAGGSITSIALVVLAAGAAAYAYVDRNRISDADRDERRTDLFPSFRVDDVSRIELIHGSERLVLDRAGTPAPSSGGEWTMTSPLREPTDAAAIDILLRELELARRVRKVDGADAKGLDAPRVRGTVWVGRLAYHFVLGDDAPIPAGAAYMRIEGEGTFVVERTLKVQLLRGADAYRDRTLIPYGASDIARVEMRAPGGTVAAIERRGPSFRVGGAGGLRASRAEVEHLFGAFADARAEAFLDGATADQAVGPQAQAVVLVPRDPTKHRISLLIGGACPSRDPALEGDVVVVRLEPTRASACAGRALLEVLGAPADSFVDKSPIAAHADEIEELRIEPVDTTGPRVDLARRGSGWHERAPEERDLDAEEADSANGLAAALADARALDVKRGEPGDRVPVNARTTIVRTGATTEVIEIGPPDRTGVAFARRIDDGAVMRISREAARRFEPHPIVIEGRSVWRTPVDPGAVVAIDDSCGRAPQRLELTNGMWKTRGGAVDNLAASSLAESIARAKADGWVAESDDGTFGFGGQGSCSVTLTLDTASDGAPPAHVGLIFGDESEGDVYTRTADGKGVFLAPVALRDLASRN